MLRYLVRICLSLLVVFGAAADPSGSLVGVVRDSLDNRPLPDVNIMLIDLGIGTSTDQQGYYEIHSIPPGEYTLEFSHIGFERKRVTSVEITAEQVKRLDVTLKPSFIELGVVEVQGVRFRQMPEDARTSVIQLRPESARMLPGAVEDVMRTLQAMPGVVTRSDFSSQLIIRGGGPDQNLIMMDDIEIFNPYRLYGLVSMFNPATVSEINLLTGGFPVRYGDRLSAVLDVRNREGRRDNPFEGNINTNITNANIVLEGRTPFGLEGSWLLSARRTYYDLIAGPIARRLELVEDDVAFPNFTDLQSKIAIGPYNNHRFYIQTLLSRDAVNLVSGKNRPTADSIAVIDQTDHQVLGVAWHYTPTNTLYSRMNLSWYKNLGDSDFEGSFLDPNLDPDEYLGSQSGDAPRMFDLDVSSLYEFRKVSFSHDLHYLHGRHALSGGGGIDFLRTRLIWSANLGPNLRDFLRELEVPFVDEFQQSRSYIRLYGYLSNRWNVADRLFIEPGLRLDVYTILENAYISPRLNVSYVVDSRSTLRMAVGRYLQSPGYEKIFGQSQFFDLTDRETVASLHPEEAIHYVIGLDRWLSDSWFVRAEAYYKDFMNLIGVDRVPGTRLTADPIAGMDQRYPSGWTSPYLIEVDSVTIMPNNDARGEAYGLEIFVEKQQVGPEDRLSGWISYTYSFANRHQYERTLPFDFDQRHTLNLVGNYRLSRSVEVGVRWRYGSGFPYTPAVGLRPRFETVEEDGAVIRRLQTDSQGRVIFSVDRGDFSNRNSARLPQYSRIDVRLNWYTSFWGVNWLFYLDVINILNRKNVIGYRYIVEDASYSERAITMFPIIPTFGVSFRF